MEDHLTQTSRTTASLRLWPGVLIVVLLFLVRFIVPLIIPEATPVGVLGSLGFGLLFLLWWLFFSRAQWVERIGGLVVMVGSLVITSFLVHESVATAMMGLMLPVYAMPGLCLAFLLWAAFCRRPANGPRWGSMILAVFIACGAWTLVKTGGFSTDLDNDFSLRWTKTPEDELLATTEELGSSSVVSSVNNQAPAWPGFRGENRDSKVYGTSIRTDWESTPPQEIWRRPIGPGWSSFSVLGNLVMTQEQRGEEEVVSAYDLNTGNPVWMHADPIRFWEANAGAGPRATPLIHEGRVYALGATGMLNVLNAVDGTVVWSRDALSDTGAKVPGWGISGSPLIVNDSVFVATAGVLAAYDVETGDLRWKGPDGWDGYSSPHLLSIDGKEQVVLMSKSGALSLDADQGTMLWNYEWPGGSRIVQPAQIENGQLLMSRGETSGLSRVSVSKSNGSWMVEEQWTTNRFKPYFSDFVVHEGNLYGFDGNRVVSVTLDGANRNWKGGRYGSGQLLLLADQDLLIVVSEQGDLALVEAKPDEFVEVATIPAIEGKTWNHPVLANGVLLVRNDREMAAFRLPQKGGS